MKTVIQSNRQIELTMHRTATKEIILGRNLSLPIKMMAEVYMQRVPK
jgi:hypothetical protein